MKSSYGMTKREIDKKNRPDVTKLYGWLEHHRSHGKPFKDATIGEWLTWRCSCGVPFQFKEIERRGDPKRYSETPPEEPKVTLPRIWK